MPHRPAHRRPFVLAATLALAGCEGASIVNAPDVAPSADVLNAPDVVSAPDVATAPDVVHRPDVVTALDVVNVLDVVTVSDVVNAPDVVDAAASTDVVSPADVVDAAIDGSLADVVDAPAASDAARDVTDVADVPPPNGETCAGAVPLAVGVTLTGQDPSGVAPTNSCGGADVLARRHYLLTVDPGQRVTVVATPTVSTDRLTVLALNRCGDGACWSRLVNNPAGAAVTTYLDNGGATARTFVLNVAGGPFTISTRAAALTDGLVCARARALTHDVPLTDQDPATASPDPSCRGATGLWYRVTVPAGHRGRVTAENTPGGAAPLLGVQTACGRVACAATAENVGGLPTTVSFDNASGSPTDYYVQVTSPTPFRVVATTYPTPPAPYTVTRVATSCVDFANLPAGATATTLANVDGDNNISPVTPLGFTLAFVGDATASVAMTHLQMASDGYLVLLPDASAAQPFYRVDTTAIPNPQSPNAIVAPFRDDLSGAGTSGGRVTVLGAAPSRVFVAEWFSRTFIDCCGVVGNNTARLRFQAKLFEGSNAIEFHYCELAANSAPPGRVSGNAAAIGVESPLGTRGTQVAYRTAGAADAAMGYRLAPAW